jgi:hypothetical protein
MATLLTQISFSLYNIKWNPWSIDPIYSNEFNLDTQLIFEPILKFYMDRFYLLTIEFCLGVEGYIPDPIQELYSTWSGKINRTKTNNNTKE